ncbi:endonuclease domain-containing protein [Sphingosinicella sp.]|uniref:endonuclease domain-containing protein n=1 Tax=Sphingosinicella sp. TaxID=1917971 RepID=UPI0040378DF4
MRDGELLERAKKMRRELTGPELKLWLELRAKRFEGAKFRRQVVIGRYIVDFACRTPVMLVVEVDGETHAGHEAYDAARTAFLESRGYRVLRFTNPEVMGNLDGVLFAIAEALPTPPPLPDPLP